VADAWNVRSATSPSPVRPDPWTPSSAASTVPGLGENITPSCPVSHVPATALTGRAMDASHVTVADSPCTSPTPDIRTRTVNDWPDCTDEGASTETWSDPLFATSGRVAAGGALEASALGTWQLIENRIRSSKLI